MVPRGAFVGGRAAAVVGPLPRSDGVDAVVPADGGSQGGGDPRRGSDPVSLAGHRTAGGSLTTLAIFGKLADGSLDVFSIITRQEMHDNPLIREFMQEATIAERRAAVRFAVETNFGAEAAAKGDAPLATITDLE